MHVGIDASNLRFGGGLTHLVQILDVADPARGRFDRVTVWTGRQTAARLPRRPWLSTITPPLLGRSLPLRAGWQRAWLDAAVRRASVDVLLVPGGSYAGSFRPFVAMCRNLVPFDDAASARYGISWLRLKWALLRRVQGATLVRADGVIFLSETARATVTASIGEPRGKQALIPHGIAPRFFKAAPAPERSFSEQRPFRWLYVSVVDGYKHQGEAVRAATRLRDEGFPLRLDFVGNTVHPWGRRLQETLAEIDADGGTVRFLGPLPFEELHRAYHEADGFLFASSCENLPNILLEAMASALPIACSERGVMPEVLGPAEIYFDPEDPASIARALATLMEQPELRARCSAEARARARQYSWPLCAERTFDFVTGIAGGGPIETGRPEAPCKP